MMKIALAVVAAAAVLTTAPVATPSKAQELKMAQVDVQIGRDRDDRYDRDHRRDHDATVGIGPGGITIGPRQHCRMVTTTIQRDDGRTITRRERRCD
jgi:Ni/Co efflux regulator RcnB